MLQGPHITLRAIEPEDLDLMYLIENDPGLWVYGTTTVPYSHYALRRFLEQTENDFFRDAQVRMVVETNDGVAIGFIDLQNYDARSERAEVGIVLMPEWHQKGLATEALRLLGEYAGQHLHLHQLYAYVAEENLPARRLFAAAGYKETATLTDWIRSAAAWQNVILFQLLF